MLCKLDSTEFARSCGPNPTLERWKWFEKRVTGTTSYIPLNVRGRRLVELTEVCYSQWDFHINPLSSGYPLSVFNKNSTLRLNKVTLSLLGQFNEKHCNSRTYEVLSTFSFSVLLFCRFFGGRQRKSSRSIAILYTHYFSRPLSILHTL